MDDSQTGYIIQFVPPKTVRQRVSGQLPNEPVTMFTLLREDVGAASPEELARAAKSEKGAVTIPLEIARKSQLRHGDVVTLIAAGGQLRITHRNGIPVVPGSSRYAISGSLDDANRLRADYSTEWLPLSQFLDDPAIRMTEAIAPLAVGKRHIIAANPFAGKTVMMQKTLIAVIRWIRAQQTKGDLRQFRIKVYTVGEREEDGTSLFDMIEKENAWDLVDLWQAPDSDNLEDLARQYHLAEWVVASAKRCTEDGIITFVFVDSFTRIFVAHARAPSIMKDPNGGLLTGGFPVESLARTKLLFAKAGVFKMPNGQDTSLTLIVTEIADEGSAEGRLYEESGPNTATGIWFLRYQPAVTDAEGLPIMPVVDINQSRQRKEWKYLPDPVYREQQWLRAAIFPQVGSSRDDRDKGRRAIQAFKFLYQYALMFKLPVTSVEELEQRKKAVLQHQANWWNS